MIFDAKVVETVINEFSGALAKREVEKIAQFHRIQASPGFHDAALHVVEQLKSYGYKPKLERFTSNGQKKYFTWDSPIGWEGKKATLELLEPEKKILARFPEVPCSLAAHSQSADMESEVIDVETGLRPDEYERKDIKGKVVLASRRTAAVYREAFLERGAAGILSYLPDRPEEPDMVPYNAIWPTKAEAKKCGFSFSLSRRDALQLKAWLAAGKTVKVRAKIDARVYSSKLDVVTAEIPGTGPEVLYIAHLCHPQPGANDNASGAACLLEIARTLKILTDKSELKLKRPVRFMWVPEMYGTLAWLDAHPKAPRNMLCCLNLDMVGENQALCRSKLRLTQTPWSAPSYLSDLVLEGLGVAGRKVQPDPTGSRNLFHYDQTMYSGGSDHYIFVEATWGVPSVMIGHWPDTFYHTHADTPDYTDATELARVGVASLLAGHYAANAGRREAEDLSVSVEGHAHRRFSELVADRFERLRNCRKDDLLAMFYRFRRHLEYAVSFEETAIYSVKQLSRSEELNYYLENAEFSLASREVAAAARMEQYVRDRLGIKGYMPAEPKNPAEQKLKRLVPKRLFKGPLAYTLLKSTPEAARYYSEATDKDDTNGQRMYEMVNYMDGKTTMMDIYRMVDAQFPLFDIELAKRFVSDLEQWGLVKTGKGRK